MTVRVAEHFHPIRMTYPIQPGPSFRAAPKIGKSRQNPFSSSELFNENRRLTVCSSIAAASPHHEEEPSNLWTPCVYYFRPRVPSWIWIRWYSITTSFLLSFLRDFQHTSVNPSFHAAIKTFIWNLMLHRHNQLYTYTRRNIVNTIMTNETQLFRKIYLSHFIRNGTKGLRKGYVWEVSWRLNKNCNILNPSSSGYSSTSFSSCGAAQPGVLRAQLTASNYNN